MRRLAISICLSAALAAPAAAQLPRPLDDSALFLFPAAAPHPATAMLAGAALATRWLGEEPFDNPAGRGGRGLWVSPALVHMSRQDLRVANRSFDEQPAFFDAASLWLGVPLGGVRLAVYGHQPILRLEDNAFSRGDIGGPVQPAVVQSQTTVREWRAGLSASLAVASVDFGAGVEATGRTDTYHYFEQSGSPDAGEREATFDGSGLGAVAGARFQPGGDQGRFTVGAAVRWMPELELTGEQRIVSPLDTSTTQLAIRRESGIEGGVSAAMRLGRAFQVLAGGGAVGAREWAFGDSATAHVATSAAFTTWSLGGEYHDPDEAWRLRFGYGQEYHDGSLEPRAGLIGLGLGFTGEGLAGDLGVLRRSIDRPGKPRSFDDRVTLTVRIAW